MTLVAFQGIAGAYSEQALRQFFGGEAESVPYKALSDIFYAVESGETEYGMLPVENAVAGSVSQSYELLLEHDLHIHADVILHVRHMLLGLPGSSLDELKQVKSTPQTLAQCQRYLARHNLQASPGFDTAGSARDVAELEDPTVGAIASELAAELYGLEILDRSIEDSQFNYTRFLVLSRENPPRSRQSKTSLLFATPHTPGVLYECLGEFARRGINLTKLESRPRHNAPWRYFFYFDFEGHYQDPICEAAMMGLLRRASFVKLLGSYPAAITPTLTEG